MTSFRNGDRVMWRGDGTLISGVLPGAKGTVQNLPAEGLFPRVMLDTGQEIDGYLDSRWKLVQPSHESRSKPLLTVRAPSAPDKALEDFRGDARGFYEQSLELLVRKQADYGPKNISNAPGGALNGLSVRLYDKISRLGNLTAGDGKDPHFESIEDTLMDILNYAAIGLMVINDAWPDK